jgi:MoxR-like ATPase
MLSGDQFATDFARLRDAICQIVRGKAEAVELALTCLLAEGHLLVEDVPGTGKTTLARALAAALGASWNRVQFTPDLMPSDVTGVTVFDQRAQQFQFHAGPIFAHVVLADEINRASPKTQSALLEVMEERHVTVDGTTHPVPQPFLVVATQNPVDMDGTYPLPEAQLDRFLMRIKLGYPDHAAEVEVLQGRERTRRLGEMPPVMPIAGVDSLIRQAEKVFVAPSVYSYVVNIAAATRTMPEVRLGASPRGSLALLRASQVRAASQGRNYLRPDDVKALAEPVLAHRILLTQDALMRGRSAADVVAAAVAATPVPQTAENV